MNEDVNENRKLFWKEVRNVKEGKVKNCIVIKGWHRIRMKCEGSGKSI